MASNTLNGVNITRISQLTLDALQTEGIPLSSFTTDFSRDAIPAGETITTRFVTVPTTQNFASSKSTAGSSTTARSIKLNQYRGVSIGFKDTELAYTDLELGQKFVKPAISALVDEMIAYVLSLVTSENGFNAHDLDVEPDDFDDDSVADLAQYLSTAKVPKEGRSLIIPPTYYASLAKTGAIKDASAYGSNAPITENRIPALHGFRVLEYNGTIPDNEEDLMGLALHPQALCVAARTIPEPPPGTWYGKVQNIVEPKTGIPIQIREHYDGTELVYQFGLLYGAAVGIPEKAARIVLPDEGGGQA